MYLLAMYIHSMLYFTHNIKGHLAAAIMTPLLFEILLIGVAIGLVIWKRIKVAEFLYNLQLPKLTELPQLLREKWRPSSPPPELAAHLV